jgi:hypothetical protein
MARKHREDDFANLVKRLNELSNFSPEKERQELLEAAKKKPRVLDDTQITLADIAKLAGIKEFKEPFAISPKAEKLIESIVNDKSDITKAIEEADKKMPKKEIKEAKKKKENRLDKIAELEAKLADLKAEQKEEQTYDAKTFREVVQKDVEEYIRSCDESALVELYNSISDNEAVYNEESSSILLKTEETKEIIADAEKLEQSVIAEKEKAAEGVADMDPNKHPQAQDYADEASGFQGQAEARHFDIRLDGDFDRDNPTSDNDAAAVKNVLKNAGIEAEVQPSEANFSSVSIHTMAKPEAVIKALGDMVDESTEYKDELSEEKK